MLYITVISTSDIEMLKLSGKPRFYSRSLSHFKTFWGQELYLNVCRGNRSLAFKTFCWA